MYKTMRRLWNKGLLEKQIMYEAVELEYLTPEQYEELVGEKYIPNDQKEDEIEKTE